MSGGTLLAVVPPAKFFEGPLPMGLRVPIWNRDLLGSCVWAFPCRASAFPLLVSEI